MSFGPPDPALHPKPRRRANGRPASLPTMSAPHSTPNASPEFDRLARSARDVRSPRRLANRSGPEGRAQLADCLRQRRRSSGLGGGHLHLDAPPLTEVELRAGRSSTKRRDRRPADLPPALRRSRYGRRCDWTLRRRGGLLRRRMCRGLEIVNRACGWFAGSCRAGLRTSWRRSTPLPAGSPASWIWTASCSSSPTASASWLTLIRRPGIVDQDFGIERFITSGISRTDRERSGRRHTAWAPGGQSPRVPSRPGPRHRHGLAPQRLPGEPTRPCIRCWASRSRPRAGRFGRLYSPTSCRGRFTEDDRAGRDVRPPPCRNRHRDARLHDQVQRLAIVEAGSGSPRPARRHHPRASTPSALSSRT